MTLKHLQQYYLYFQNSKASAEVSDTQTCHWLFLPVLPPCVSAISLFLHHLHPHFWHTPDTKVSRVEFMTQVQH